MDNTREDAQEEVSFNLATYLLLPLIELTENSFGEDKGDELNFVNCYLTKENYVAVEVKKWNDVLVTAINNQYYFTDFPIENGNQIILYRVKGSNLPDLEAFRSGKYSQFSQIAKDKIVIFNGFNEKEYIVRVLNGDIRLRQTLANELDVSIDLVPEAKSSPDKANFIDIAEYLPLHIEELEK